MDSFIASRTTRLHALDSLRGIAAITVAWFHLSRRDGLIPGHAVLSYLAVDFFFILSGFVLAYRYRDDLQNDRIDFGSFVGYRIARLYPLHLLTMMFIVLAFLFSAFWSNGAAALAPDRIGAAFPDAGDGRFFTFLLNAALLQNVGLNPGGLVWNIPNWSISVEFWAGLGVFYLVKKVLPKHGMPLLILLAGASYLLVYFSLGHLDATAGNAVRWLNLGLLRGFGGITLGVLCFAASAHADRLHWPRWAWHSAELACLCGIAAVMIRRQQFTSADFWSIPIFACAVIVFSLDRGVFSRLLSTRLFVWLGERSYSIYLNHFSLVIIINAIGYRYLYFYFPGLLLLSHLTYSHVERPLQRRFRQWMSMRALPVQQSP